MSLETARPAVTWALLGRGLLCPDVVAVWRLSGVSCGWLENLGCGTAAASGLGHGHLVPAAAVGGVDLWQLHRQNVAWQAVRKAQLVDELLGVAREGGAAEEGGTTGDFYGAEHSIGARWPLCNAPAACLLGTPTGHPHFYLCISAHQGARASLRAGPHRW